MNKKKKCSKCDCPNGGHYGSCPTKRGKPKPEKEVVKVKIVDWMYEDEMSEDQMYNALYPLSKVNFVRMFPKTIEVTK